MTSSGPTSQTELAKPNALIAMRPTRGRLTTIARKVYNSILFQTQQALADPEDARSVDGYFEAPLRVLLTDASIDADSGRTLQNVKRYLEEMQSTQVDWLSISGSDRLLGATSTPGEEILFDSSGLLYRSKIVRRDGLLWVRWRLPEEIVTALGTKENVLWTRLQLQTIARLSSYCAVALYEICSRYKTHVAGLTGRQSVEWWTDALNHAPDGAERREWRKFKAEKLKPAIEEINQVTDIQIELIEHKKGRAVGEVQFSIKRVSRAAVASDNSPVVDLALYERAKRAGLGEEQTADLCRRFGEDRVRNKLRELEVRVASQELPKIISSLAYFKTILRSGDADAETVAETSDPGPLSPSEIQVHNAVERSRSQQAEQHAALDQRIRTEFEMLPDEDKVAFTERTLERFLTNAACTGVLRSRIQQKQYEHPMLVAVVRNAFAESRYGPNWRDGLPEA